MKRVLVLLTAISMLVVLSSCSSDPYENAGNCVKPGDSKVIESKVAVCTGLEDNFKWYFEGKYFEDIKLLALIENNSTELDSQIYNDLTEQNLWQSFMKQELGITIEMLSEYTNGDSRWDGLIETKARYDSESDTQDYLLSERFRLNSEYRLGKATYSEAYEVQENQISHMNGALSRARNEYEQKLAVLKSEIGNKYSITDYPNLIFFIARQ